MDQEQTEYKKIIALEHFQKAYEHQMKGELEEAVGLYKKSIEIHPTAEEHPSKGVETLREMGWPEEFLRSILSHASYTGVPRTERVDHALFACDELCGLVVATALVKPGKSLAEVDARSVLKKMKDKAFARNVSREDVVLGAEELGRPLDEHVDFVVRALQGVASSLDP